MAIAVDSNNAGTNGSTGTSLTWSHTCAAGALLVVVVAYSAVHAALSATYNSVAMTKSSAVINDGAERSVSIFYILNPSSGANDIVVTKSNGVEIAGGSISFTGANTSSIGSSNTSSGNSTTPSLTVTTTGTGAGYVVDIVVAGQATSITISGGQTQINNILNYGGGPSDTAASYEAYTGGADPTGSYTLGASDPWLMAGLEVMEATSGPANVKTFQGLATASVKTAQGLAIASVKTKNGLA